MATPAGDEIDSGLGQGRGGAGPIRAGMDRVGAKALVALFSMLMVASLCALAVVRSAGGWALSVAAMAVLATQLFFYLVSEVERTQLQMLLRYALGHLPDTPPPPPPPRVPPPSWGPSGPPPPPPWGPGPPRPPHPPPPSWGTGMARPPPPPWGWGPGPAGPPPPPWGPGPPRPPPPPPPPRKTPSSPSFSFSSGSSPSFRVERPAVRAAAPPPRPIRGPLFARAPIQWMSSSSDASSSSSSSRGRQPSVRAASPPASLGGSTPPSPSSPRRTSPPGPAHLSGSPPSVRSARVSPPPAAPRPGAGDASAAQANAQQRRSLPCRRNVSKRSSSV